LAVTKERFLSLQTLENEDGGHKREVFVPETLENKDGGHKREVFVPANTRK
jgi:hypothetical protein